MTIMDIPGGLSQVTGNDEPLTVSEEDPEDLVSPLVPHRISPTAFVWVAGVPRHTLITGK